MAEMLALSIVAFIFGTKFGWILRSMRSTEITKSHTWHHQAHPFRGMIAVEIHKREQEVTWLKAQAAELQTSLRGHTKAIKSLHRKLDDTNTRLSLLSNGCFGGRRLMIVMILVFLSGVTFTEMLRATSNVAATSRADEFVLDAIEIHTGIADANIMSETAGGEVLWQFPPCEPAMVHRPFILTHRDSDYRLELEMKHGEGLPCAVVSGFSFVTFQTLEGPAVGWHSDWFATLLTWSDQKFC